MCLRWTVCVCVGAMFMFPSSDHPFCISAYDPQGRGRLVHAPIMHWVRGIYGLDRSSVCQNSVWVVLLSCSVQAVFILSLLPVFLSLKHPLIVSHDFINCNWWVCACSLFLWTALFWDRQKYKILWEWWLPCFMYNSYRCSASYSI